MRRVSLTALLVSLLLLVTTGPAGFAHAAPDKDKMPDDAFLTAMTGGNTVGAPIREAKPRADGFKHIDTPAMIARLKQMHVTMYTYGVWDLASDWDDLRNEFAPAAQDAGIDIQVYIVPPSECFLNDQRHLDGRCSRPFNMDYVRWATEIAKLSVEYPNVTSWGIDDFLVGQNGDLFTRDYLRQVRDAQDAVNPDLKWYVTLYYDQINATNVDIIKDTLDGVIYPYVGYTNNTIDPTWLERRLDGARGVLQPAGLELALLVYTGRFLDGMIHPTEDYVAEVMRRAKPYLFDGRISGIIAYGAPVRIDQHQPSRDYLARTGNGRLSLSVSNFTSTADGAKTTASQQVTVDPDAARKTLTFSHRDPNASGSEGYQFKQVLVDDTVVWDQDVTKDPGETWLKTTVDLTEALAGKTSATITFRLEHKKGVGWWPLDFAVDDVSARGLKMRNGGFESKSGWDLSRTHDGLQPYIEIYAKNRPARIINAIGAAYASFKDEPFQPAAGGSWPGLQVSPENRAMYGNGRLAFTIPANTPVEANTCATASQRVKVQPGLPRYELSFWHADPYQANFDQAFKEIYIDDRELWKRDVGDFWPWFYVNGSDHQGVIDVTDFVKGKESVELTFKFCVAKQRADFQLDAGVDHLETVGLGVTNPDFETPDGWTLTPSGPIAATIDRHGPPVPMN